MKAVLGLYGVAKASRMKLLLGTANPAKIRRYRGLLPNTELVTPDDLDLAVTVEEGANPQENAYLKAKAYSNASGLPCLATDEALELDFLPAGEQPGAYVRRVFGRRLDDLEMVEHYRELLAEAPPEKRKGRFILHHCLYFSDARHYSMVHTEEAEFRLPGAEMLNPGHPLAALHFLPAYNCYAAELPEVEKIESMKDLADKLKELIATHLGK